MEEYPMLGKILKNGITEYIYPVEGLEDNNFLALTVKAGSAVEEEYNAGIAHFVEHAQMSFFDEREEAYRCFAYTNFYSTTFYFDVKTYAMDRVADLVQGIISGKFLKKVDIEKVRKEVLREYKNMINKNHESDFRILLENSEYASHYAIGTRECINNFSLNDIWKFYKIFYLLGNMCIIWIGPEKDIKETGTEWIKKLSGIQGNTKLRILEYAFPLKKVKVPKCGGERTDYYFFRKRKERQDTIDEVLLFILEEILNQYAGNIQVEKIYLSCQQEFIHIVSWEKNKDWNEIYKIIEEISWADWMDKYKNFFKKQLIGYNCDLLREQFVNVFIFDGLLTEQRPSIKKEMLKLMKLLKTSPVIISK